MNSLVVFDSEFIEPSVIRIAAPRVEQLWRAYLKLSGQEIRIAIFGGDRGVASLRKADSQEIILDVRRMEPSLPLRPIELVVGLSRPQTLKKVIQTAVMTGVSSLHLVQTELGEKSYGTSHILEAKALHDETIKALEQTGEGMSPTISIHRSFSHFAQNGLRVITNNAGTSKILAHPGGVALGSAPRLRQSDRGVLAVGPESGWSVTELEIFDELDFTRVGLGPRVMRVEIALSFLLGQLQVLSRL
ncbi:MAG: Ribosomal small subunit methyltransferase [Pseudomonadota bacterium]